MGASTVPTHGKMGAIFAIRPNGFVGSAGLNDLTWGLGYSGGATAYFEVEIEHAAAPDKFRWRKNGGAWNEDVDITGAEQTLSDGQKLTFAAITGHTVGDKWVIGNLKAEPTSEAGTQAQITAAGNQILNPNHPPTWIDDTGKVALQVNFTNGLAIFNGNVGNVTVEGNGGYIPAAALQIVGYLIDWNMAVTLDMADISSMGQNWKQGIPGMAGGNGGANAYFIAAKSMFDTLKRCIEGGDKYYLLKLFTNDPDQDGTGDGFSVWASFTSFNLTTAMGDVVKESVSFQITGGISTLINS